MGNSNSEQIKALQDTVKELESIIIQLTTAAARIGIIIAVTKKHTTIAVGSEVVSVPTPKPTFKLGQAVRVLGDSMQPLDLTEFPTFGDVAKVSRISNGVVYVRTDHSERVVINGVPDQAFKAGASVILDSTKLVLVRVLEPGADEHDFTENTGVNWDDIIGNIDAKRTLREAIELPRTKSDILDVYGYKPPKGVLLYGSPGCGKTMLGKAAATALAAANGKTGVGGFMYVKGPAILDPYVGVAEATVRELFEKARAFEDEHGVPAVIFIDECDAILGTRGDLHSHMEKTIVPAFLAEMDGLGKSGALVILATNRPDILDPAVTREGRIDRKIAVERPTQAEAIELLSRRLSKVPMSPNAPIPAVAEAAINDIYCPTRVLDEVNLQSGDMLKLTLKDVVSGAMIADVADQAVNMAVRRDMASGKVEGITGADVMAAARQAFVQNFDVDHRDAIADLANGRAINNVRKPNVAVAA